MMEVEESPSSSSRPQVIMPGDDLTSYLLSQQPASLKLGKGLDHHDGSITATCAGELVERNNTVWVETSRKRYYPRVGDQVVGIIEDKGGDFYIVNIFSGTNCILNRLSFEGATKRNKPELKRGDVVYARVTRAGKDIDTELSCLASTGSKKEWSSGETVYGPLNQGLLLNVSTGMARKLLRPDCAVLNALGKYYVYEAAVGMNGAVWFRSNGNAMEHIIIRNAVLNAEFLDDVKTEVMVDRLVELSNKSKKRN